jgi:hypothetical protein
LLNPKIDSTACVITFTRGLRERTGELLPDRTPSSALEERDGAARKARSRLHDARKNRIRAAGLNSEKDQPGTLKPTHPIARKA